MLLLQRRDGETIHIGDNITVLVKSIQGKRVTLAIEAPRELLVLRGELLERNADESPPARHPRHALDYTPGELDRTAPERVWLQLDTDGDNQQRDETWAGRDGVTWCDESIGGLEIQYIRADLSVPSPGESPE